MQVLSALWHIIIMSWHIDTYPIHIMPHDSAGIASMHVAIVTNALSVLQKLKHLVIHASSNSLKEKR